MTTINVNDREPNAKAIKTVLDIHHQFLCPRGAILPYASSIAPQDWLLCDGSAISRETYDRLFSLIGTTYGNGDGTTTFNLPDLRSRMVIGMGNGVGLSNRNIADNGGEETHTLTTTEMPSHSHGVTDAGHTHTYVDTYRTGNQDTDNAFSTEVAANETTTNQSKTTGSSTTGISINNAGSGEAHNIMNPYLVLNYIIKY